MPTRSFDKSPMRKTMKRTTPQKKEDVDDDDEGDGYSE
jgi:hypothetical protein